MSGENEIPEPIDLNERMSSEVVSLRKPFQYAVEDFVRTYKDYGKRGWMTDFPAEAKLDVGYISNEVDILPELKIAEEIPIPFVNVKIEGILQFIEIANDADLSDKQGVDTYLGVAVARALLAYAREYRYVENRSVENGHEIVTRRSVFNEEMLNGFDARASLHNTVSNSRFNETLLDGLSLHLMSDKTVTNLQTYRAMFGLMYHSHDTKYLEMMNAFDSHFELEIEEQEEQRKKIAQFVQSGQIDQRVYDKWMADSYTDIWFASVHPFDEEEIEALLG